MVLRPEKEAEARAVFEKWDLDFAIVGETIAEDRFLVVQGGEVKADLPLKALSGTAPEYDRAVGRGPGPGAARPGAGGRSGGGAARLAGSPNYCSRSWVWTQYDQQVMADTVLPPGSDAGVVRVHGTGKAIAFTSDVTPRYCRANPERGGMQAVAEAYRNLTATGAAAGGDRQPELRQPREAGDHGAARRLRARHRRGLRGARHADRLGQRQPLQRDRGAGDPADADDRRGRPARPARRADPDGAAGGRRAAAARREPGASRAVGAARRALGREEGDAPPVDLAAERAAGAFARAAKAEGLVAAAHDLGDGGLALAAAEMALAGAVGVEVFADDAIEPVAWFFGEDQGRYLLACPPEDVDRLLARAVEAAVPLRVAGAAGGEAVRLGEAKVGLAALREAHEGGCRGCSIGRALPQPVGGEGGQPASLD